MAFCLTNLPRLEYYGPIPHFIVISCIMAQQYIVILVFLLHGISTRIPDSDIYIKEGSVMLLFTGKMNSALSLQNAVSFKFAAEEVQPNLPGKGTIGFIMIRTNDAQIGDFITTFQYLLWKYPNIVGIFGLSKTNSVTELASYISAMRYGKDIKYALNCCRHHPLTSYTHSSNDELRGKASVLLIHNSNGCTLPYQDTWEAAGIHYLRLCQTRKTVPILENYLRDHPLVDADTRKPLVPLFEKTINSICGGGYNLTCLREFLLPTPEPSKQPIRTGYLGHVTVHQVRVTIATALITIATALDTIAFPGMLCGILNAALVSSPPVQIVCDGILLTAHLFLTLTLVPIVIRTLRINYKLVQKPIK
eukprot:sb/3465969/